MKAAGMFGDRRLDLLEAPLSDLGRRGLVEAGLARRVGIVARLAGTLSTGADAVRSALSGESLAQEMGSSRASVHKHVGQLRAQGFSVESVAGVGYRLTAPFDDLVAGEAVLPYVLLCSRAAEGHSAAEESHAGQELLATEECRVGEQPPAFEQMWVAGLPYVYRASCDSTNRALRDMMAAGDLPAGATVVADHQTQGRGRLDRVWRDEAGKDLTLSVLLRPSLAPGQAHLLSLAAALAVAETAEEYLGPQVPVGVKWPNDVVVGDRKLCGILAEGSMDADRLRWAIVGVGLNVNSQCSSIAATIEAEDQGGLAGRPAPVSLRDLVGEVPRAPLLATLLERLTLHWTDLERSSGAAKVLAGLRKRDVLLGRPLQVFGGSARGGTEREEVVSGVGAGLGPEGQLLVRAASGDTVAVFAGDVTLRKASA